MSSLAIVAAFSGLPDARRGAGRRHDQALCIALFTLASSAGCRGFLLDIDYEAYSRCLAEFFVIEPLALETMAMDGKVLRGSYNLDTPAFTTESHRAIQLVTVYMVERGLMPADSTCGL